MADGVAQPIATGLAGIALLVLSAFYQGQSFPLILGLLCIVSLLVALAVAVGRGYGKTLLVALSRRRLKGTELVLTDATARAALHSALSNPQPGTVIYAIRMLTGADPKGLGPKLQSLLSHPDTWVRRSALNSVAELGQSQIKEVVRELLSTNTSAEERAVIVRCLARLGDTASVSSHMSSGPQVVQGAAIAALLAAKNTPENKKAAQHLNRLIVSDNPSERLLAAEIIADGHASDAVVLARRLLSDDIIAVRRATLQAAGHLDDVALWPDVMTCLENPAMRNAAANALVSGPGTLPAVLSQFGDSKTPRPGKLALIAVCGRKQDKSAIAVLVPMITCDDSEQRDAVLAALQLCGFHADRSQQQVIHTALRREVTLAAGFAAAINDITPSDNAVLVVDALEAEIAACRTRIIALLSFVGSAAALTIAAEGLSGHAPDKRAYALEVIDTQTPTALRSTINPLFDAATAKQVFERLGYSFENTPMDRAARLAALVFDDTGATRGWTRACALYVSISGGVALDRNLLDGRTQSEDRRLREMATSLLTEPIPDGERPMLSTIEKVLILRAAGIFAETSDDILADVADVAHVIDQAAGTTVFEKDSLGFSMFIIASGQVGVYDGVSLLNTFGPGDVFGEMALLDPEPRSATARAVDDVQLLQLDQEALFDLIDMRPEVARGLLRVITQRLRARMQDLALLQDAARKTPENG